MSLHQEIFGFTDGASPDGADPTGARGGTRRRPARHRVRRRVPPSVGLLVLVLVAGALRLVGVTTAYDVYGDEFFYRDAARSLMAGHFPPLDGAGLPILIHPPGYFLLEAGWIALFGQGGDPFGQVASLRVLQALVGVVSVVLLYVIVRRIVGRSPAVVAGLLLAADPYVLRQNGRVLLESATVMLVLAGYVLLVDMAGSPRRATTRRACGTGLLFGLALVTKDMAAVLTILPALVMVVAGWGPSRRTLLTVIGASVVPYTLLFLWLTEQGLVGAFWDAKTSGLRRIFGSEVFTGYNAEGSPVITTLVARLGEYGVSFAITGVGVVAAGLLLARPRSEADRVMALFTLGGTVTVVYAAFFSTIEDQFLYFVTVPAIATAVLGSWRLITSSSYAGIRRRFVAAVVASLVLVLVLDGAAWLRTRLVPDDAQEQAVTWLTNHVRDGATVAVTGDTTPATLVGSGLSTVPLTARPERLREDRVRYAVVLTKLVDQGYVDFPPGRGLSWYEARSTRVFAAPSRSYGMVLILRSKSPAGGWRRAPTN